MRLLFDITAIQPSQGKFHGAGEYAKAVLVHLLKSKKRNSIYGCYNPDEWLDPDIDRLLKKNSVQLFQVKGIKDMENLIKKEGFDKFYTALSYDYYSADFSATSFIYTMHGLRDLEMPTDFYEFLYSRKIETLIKWGIKNIFPGFYENMIKKRLKKLLDKSTHGNSIIVDSEHTKYSLINFYPYLDRDNIIVLYPPKKHVSVIAKNNQEKEILLRFGVEKNNYILLISGNRWIKNAYRGIKALDEIFSQQKNVTVNALVVGGKSLQSVFMKLKNRDRFIFTDYVEDFELETFYKNSHSFLYPTLNEGFGYPPLEAMKYGKPVACSAIASVSEICGNAAVYFNPFRIDEIKNRMLMLMLDDKIHSEYSKKSQKKYSDISKVQDKMLERLSRILLED